MGNIRIEQVNLAAITGIFTLVTYYLDFNSRILCFSEVTATHLKVGDPSVDENYDQSSNAIAKAARRQAPFNNLAQFWAFKRRPSHRPYRHTRTGLKLDWCRFWLSSGKLWHAYRVRALKWNWHRLYSDKYSAKTTFQYLPWLLNLDISVSPFENQWGSQKYPG